MAAIVPDLKTDQLTQIEPPAYAPLTPRESGGRLRMAYFYTKPTAAVAADKVIACCNIPANARIIGGSMCSNGFVANSTLNVGLIGLDGNGYINKAGTVADDDDLLGTLLAVATAGTYSFANTQAFNMGYQTDKEVQLIATLKTAGMDGANDILSGYVLYVVD